MSNNVYVELSNRFYISSTPIPGESIIHQDLHTALGTITSDAVQQLQQQPQQQLHQQHKTQQQQSKCNGQSDSSGRSTPITTSNELAPGKLFVGGLSWQTSSEKLQEYFGVFGTVTDVLIMKDPVTQVWHSFVSIEKPCIQFEFNVYFTEEPRFRIHNLHGTGKC